MKKNRYQMPTMEVITLATQFCLAGAGSGSAPGPGAGYMSNPTLSEE